MLPFYVKTRIGFSLRDKGLVEITEVKIMRVDCSLILGTLKIKNVLISVHRKEDWTLQFSRSVLEDFNNVQPKQPFCL